MIDDKRSVKALGILMFTVRMSYRKIGSPGLYWIYNVYI